MLPVSCIAVSAQRPFMTSFTTPKILARITASDQLIWQRHQIVCAVPSMSHFAPTSSTFCHYAESVIKSAAIMYARLHERPSHSLPHESSCDK